MGLQVSLKVYFSDFFSPATRARPGPPKPRLLGGPWAPRKIVGARGPHPIDVGAVAHSYFDWNDSGGYFGGPWATKNMFLEFLEIRLFNIATCFDV